MQQSENASPDAAAGPEHTFSAVRRVYGDIGFERLSKAHVCVVGIGGVGSWVAEALARSGIGMITLIDHDDITATNINRQVHSDHSTLSQAKVSVMAGRINLINPGCNCISIDDMLVTKNMDKYIDRRFDFVVDAIDAVTFKASLIVHCKRNKIPVITIGGAGGRTNPGSIEIADLNKTWNDTLASRVRKRLRQKYGWSRNPSRRYGV